MKKLIYILLFIIISCDMEKDVLITINTPYGDMKAILFEETPLHKKNFITLTKEEKFNSTIFHRVIKDFMIQGGDPTGTGSGGPGYQFEDEFNLMDPAVVSLVPIFILSVSSRSVATHETIAEVVVVSVVVVCAQ